MANLLLDKLREKDKKNLFFRTNTAISYPTGFQTFDYKNGQMIKVMDIDENILEEYPSIGLVGGSWTTIIGKSGVAKTTFAVQAASNIVKNFDNGLVIHFDLEQVLSYTRIKNVTGLSQKEIDQKYILKQDTCYLEDINITIREIAELKEKNKKDFTYETGLKNEFNEPILCYVPTIVIIDSIPTLTTREEAESINDELVGKTAEMHRVAAISQFLKRIISILKKYNIMVIAINHIGQKISINPFANKSAQLLYMKQDETVPGGNALLFLANNVLKFIAVGGEKYIEEKNGFDGFMVRCEILKSRTAPSGASTNLIYKQKSGFSSLSTLINYSIEKDLIDGRNPNKYFKDYPEIKFDDRKYDQDFIENQDLMNILHKSTIKMLMKDLKTNSNYNNSPYTVEDHIKLIEEVTKPDIINE